MTKQIVVDDIPDLDGEIWKPIDGYDNRYMISNYGRVKSYCYKKAYLKILEPNSKGYLRVKLSYHNKRQRPFVHRLVALYFVPNDDPLHKTTVDHINGDKTCNCYWNLQWLSLSDNIKAYFQNQKEIVSKKDLP